MVAKEVKITNEQGLHMRPAGVFAKEMTKFNSDVTLVFNGKRVNAKSVMLIIAACIKCGSGISRVRFRRIKRGEKYGKGHRRFRRLRRR